MDLQTRDRADPDVAALPDREPDLPEAGGERSAAQRRALTPARVASWALAAALLVALAALAWHFAPRPHRTAARAWPDTLRAVAATVVLFAVGGFGVVRLLLPAALRRYELLWVLPTGACAVGLALTVLGFAAVPYPVSLALVLAAGLGLGFWAVRRHGWPELAVYRQTWPAYVAVLVLAVALVPMVFVQQYLAPVGTGSDAHVAAGVGQFLKHSYPTSVNVSQPINQMNPLWASKYPIYYALAGISTLSGLATWQVLAIVAAEMLALAAVGLFLVAREVFGAPAAVSVAAMGLAAVDREALHTVLNPYFNQTWGFFAMPFTLVLGWWVVQPDIGRRARQGTALLLAMFALVLVFAYPLAAPIPLVPIVVFIWLERRRRRALGQPVLRVGGLYQGRRSLLWMVPLAVLLAVPVAGVLQKAGEAIPVLLPGHALTGSWKGDLNHFIPFDRFLSLPNSPLAIALVVGVLLLAVRGLAGQPRSLSWGLGGLLAIGLLLGLYFRQRQAGWYLEFKLLAFIGPLVLLIATIGAAKLGRIGLACVAVLAICTAGSIVAEIKGTGSQLPKTTIQLAGWTKSLAPDASIRLDMWPPNQLWAGYFLSARPLCSQTPLLGTDYPHVPASRKADYIVASPPTTRPRDAIGGPLRINGGYVLYKENPAVSGVSRCSKRRLDRVYTGAGHSPL
jgi:hypothetical protein